MGGLDDVRSRSAMPLLAAVIADASDQQLRATQADHLADIDTGLSGPLSRKKMPIRCRLW